MLIILGAKSAFSHAFISRKIKQENKCLGIFHRAVDLLDKQQIIGEKTLDAMNEIIRWFNHRQQKQLLQKL